MSFCGRAGLEVMLLFVLVAARGFGCEVFGTAEAVPLRFVHQGCLFGGAEVLLFRKRSRFARTMRLRAYTQSKCLLFELLPLSESIGSKPGRDLLYAFPSGPLYDYAK